MNCLVTDERREVGMFEREVRLEEGVKVADENISAKLEDGILRVVIPKVIQEEEEGWESVRKVELE
jgi:HSP20 family protein